MTVKFDFHKGMEYYLFTNSEINIEGKGTWWVDEGSLKNEYDTREDEDQTSDEFIRKYFWLNLDIDPDNIKFEEESYSKLCKYLEE